MSKDGEDKNGSTEQQNPGNPDPSSVASFTSVFQSPEFVSMMSKALLPTIVDGVKHSLSSPAQSESHGSGQAERLTGSSSGSTKGKSSPSTSSGSTKGSISPSGAAGSSSGISYEPPAKIVRLTIDDTNNGPAVSDSIEQQEYDPLDVDDILESSSQRWQASEELSALLNVCFVKPLSGFDKREIVRSCPRPDVDCVYTPVLDKFLPDLVPKCKSEDKVLRKTQDLLLDVAGPIAMSYEMVWQAKENSQSLDLSTLLSCLTRSLQLLGNVNNHVSAKRRAQVLSKIGPKYASLSNESWETNGKELFGQQFEQRLKQRSETAKAISTATFVQRGKPFFPRGTPSAKPWNRGGGGGGAASYRSPHFRGQTYRPSRPFRGRGRTTAPFTQSTPQSQ